MKDGYIIKNSSNYSLNSDELDLINNYTRRKLTKDEVYIFSIVLCDNDIDREYEQFSKEALDKLSELFVGKTGIMNHDAKSENQLARIFLCEVEKVDNKVNSIGEQYYRLIAKAYMPICDKNKDLILEIDSGIKKEISVGCSVKSMTCSICGNDVKNNPCNHVKGKIYNNKTCHVILSDPLDAYEWSFVAVPAQKNAGVIKMFKSKKKGGAHYMLNVIKSLKAGETVTIDYEQAQQLCNLINELERLAKAGKEYSSDLKNEVIRLSAKVDPEIDSEVMNSVTEKMTIPELKAFKKAFEIKSGALYPIKPQLISLNNNKNKSNYKNNDFKI